MTDRWQKQYVSLTLSVGWGGGGVVVNIGYPDITAADEDANADNNTEAYFDYRGIA